MTRNQYECQRPKQNTKFQLLLGPWLCGRCWQVFVVQRYLYVVKIENGTPKRWLLFGGGHWLRLDCRFNSRKNLWKRSRHIRFSSFHVFEKISLHSMKLKVAIFFCHWNKNNGFQFRKQRFRNPCYACWVSLFWFVIHGGSNLFESLKQTLLFFLPMDFVLECLCSRN